MTGSPTYPGFVAYHSATGCTTGSCSAALCNTAHPAGHARPFIYVRSSITHTVSDISHLLTESVECAPVTVHIGGVGTGVATVFTFVR